MTRPRVARAQDHALLLAISVSGVVLAVLALREAAPSDLGVRMADRGGAHPRSRDRIRALAPGEAPGGGRAPARRVGRRASAARRRFPTGCSSSTTVAFGPSIDRSASWSGSTRTSCSARRPRTRSGRRSTGTRSRHGTPSSRRAASVDGELTFRHRDGGRIRVIASGRAVSDEAGRSQRLVTVRDVSAGHRRELRLAELASHDSETGLLNRVEFEKRLGDAVRRALATGSERHRGPGGAHRRRAHGRRESSAAPRRSSPSQRLRALLRVDDEIARTGEGELAWILHDTDAHGGVGAVARARTDLAALEGIALTVGICDLETAGDALALYAFADRALAAARGQGRRRHCAVHRQDRAARRERAGHGPWHRASAPDAVTARSGDPGDFGHCCASAAGGSVLACPTERQAVCPSSAATGVSRCSSGRPPDRRSARTSRRSR